MKPDETVRAPWQEIVEYLVEVGKGPKGAYLPKYRFVGPVPTWEGAWRVPAQVALYYEGVNLGNGYKKRLVIRTCGCPSGKVLARERSY